MNKLKQAIFALSFIVICLIVSVNAQIYSVTQLTDLKPTDPSYRAVQTLVERYGILDSFPDGTFRPDQPLTRGEFVKLLDRALDTLNEFVQAQDAKVPINKLFKPYSANKLNVTSIEQIKDIRATNEFYASIDTLITRFGVDLTDADYKLRPEKQMTEKEFSSWIEGIFTIKTGQNPPSAKTLLRRDWAIAMAEVLKITEEKIVMLMENSAVNNQTSASENAKQSTEKAKPIESRSKLEIIQNLPSSGKARITSKKSFYLPDNLCTDLSRANADLKFAVENGGIWGDYRMNKGDIGDVVFETSNTCEKGKLVLLRVGTAIVTIGADDVKKIK